MPCSNSNDENDKKNKFPVNPCNGLAPDVIGEGEVTAITFPDGTIQYYFIPARLLSDVYSKRWPTYPFINGYCNGPQEGIWIIRNFSNAVLPVFNQYWQTNAEPLSKPCFNNDCSVPLGFQLKFHNDCWTSTTDLHYFCPSVRRPLPTCSASVQVEISNEQICPRHMVDYNIPCTSKNCARTGKDKKKYNLDRCKCQKEKTKCASSMSIDKSRTSSETCCKKSRFGKKKRKKSYSSTSCSSSHDRRRNFRKKNKVKQEFDSQCSSISKIKNNRQKDVGLNTKSILNTASKKVSTREISKAHCECNVKSISDKAIVTYNDQASSVKEIEGQTQTGRNLSGSCLSLINLKRRESDSTLWIPRRLHKRNRYCTHFSDKIIGVCEMCDSGCSSSSCISRSSTSRGSVK